jgi:hypothetical protein
MDFTPIRRMKAPPLVIVSQDSSIEGSCGLQGRFLRIVCLDGFLKMAWRQGLAVLIFVRANGMLIEWGEITKLGRNQ